MECVRVCKHNVRNNPIAGRQLEGNHIPTSQKWGMYLTRVEEIPMDFSTQEVENRPTGGIPAALRIDKPSWSGCGCECSRAVVPFVASGKLK